MDDQYVKKQKLAAEKAFNKLRQTLCANAVLEFRDQILPFNPLSSLSRYKSDVENLAAKTNGDMEASSVRSARINTAL